MNQCLSSQWLISDTFWFVELTELITAQDILFSTLTYTHTQHVHCSGAGVCLGELAHIFTV